MHNPLALLTPELLDALIDVGNQYFVRQSYDRGKNPLDQDTKEALLITPYTEFNNVNTHFQAIKFDRRKYVYQIAEKEELEKLKMAASQPVGYQVYVALLHDRRWTVPKTLAPKIENYLRAFTRWKPKGGEQIRVNLFIQYGELFLTFQYRSEELKIPLSDVEKI